LWRVTDRPLLKTLWPALRRGPGQVQFGTVPEQAVVVEGLHEDEIEALELLDGTRETPAALATDAGRDVLELLVGQGLVVDAVDPLALPPAVRAVLAHDTQALLRTCSPPTRAYAALSRRRAAHVLVLGRGALPLAISAQLRRAGTGRVVQGPHVVEDWELTPDRSGAVAPALVVPVGAHALEATPGHPWRRRGIPVLPVVLHGTEAVVGPLVLPGGPCLRCLDLARADLDPAWPALLGQLAHPAVGDGAEVSGETTLVALAASMTAMVGLAAIDGRPLPLGRSLEVGLPWPRVRQRQWEVHPRCGCTVSDTSAQPARVDPPTQARMAG
jgi:hypothetical protein